MPGTHWMLSYVFTCDPYCSVKDIITHCRCRELGLKRWPYRKLKSMDKLLNSIESIHGSDPQVYAMSLERFALVF